MGLYDVHAMSRYKNNFPNTQGVKIKQHIIKNDLQVRLADLKNVKHLLTYCIKGEFSL